jgi:secretion/DNA translocation related TadE-like protein
MSAARRGQGLGRAGERGAMAVFVMALAGFAIGIALLLAVMSALAAAKARAAAAADAAALAGADELANGRLDSACAAAVQVAASNGARLVSCTVDASALAVAVVVARPVSLPGFREVRDQARADVGSVSIQGRGSGSEGVPLG